MKFCEKLQKLRKEKGYSQEELADLLEVSRQSVSKWESGTTYPEMDKLLSLCKIFNVSLDDLTNDEVSTDNIKEKNKNNFSNLIYTILEMINKSIEMFKNMNRREVVKCIAELFIVFLILMLLKIPFYYINESIGNIFINFPTKTYAILNSIWLFISNIIYLVLFVSIFIYIYKSRYLDKFDPDKIRKIVVQEEKEEIEEVKREKEVISNSNKKTEKSSFIIFDFLGAVFNIFIKVCLFFITIPIIFCFVFLVIATAFVLLFQLSGINYFGLTIIFIGLTVACYVFMEIFVRALFSNSINFKRLFLTFTISIVVFGIGVGITAVEFTNTKYYEELPSSIPMGTYEVSYDMNDELLIHDFIHGYYYNNNINYIVDETLTDEIKISIDYYEEYNDVHVNLSDNRLLIYYDASFNKTMKMLNLVKENLKDKEIYNYEELFKLNIKITTSSTNVEKLKDNISKEKEREAREEVRYNYYINENNALQIEIERKDSKIEELEYQIDELKQRLENIQRELKEAA